MIGDGHAGGEVPRRGFTPGRGAVILIGLLVVVVLAAYGGTLGAGFVYDDHRLIEGNRFLDDLSRLPDVFTRDLAGGTSWQIYRPLPAATFMIDLALWGGRPIGFHLGNIAWHLIAALALAWLGRELLIGPGGAAPGRAGTLALVAAIVHAAHPINSEAVAWACRRPDLMAGAAVLAALAAYARYLRTSRVRWVLASALLTAVGLLSKEIAVITPVLCAVLAFLGSGSMALSRGRALVAAGAIGLWLPLYGWLRWALFGTVSGQPVGFVQNWVVGLDGGERVLAHLALVGRYLGLLVFPRTLSADYSWRSIAPPGSPFDAHVILGVVAIGGSVALVIWALRGRRAPVIAFALILEAAAFLPVSSWVVPIGTAFAERLFYLPAAGCVLAVSALLARVADRDIRWRVPWGRPGAPATGRHTRWAVAMIGLLLVAGFGYRTHLRVYDWKSDLTLFRSTLDAYPDNVVARTYVAIALQDHGDLDGALAEYRRALEVLPGYDLARINLALLLLARGDADGAMREAQRVIERDPASGAARITLARALGARGREAEAERELIVAARDPRTRLEALVLRGELLLARGRTLEARRVIDEAAALAPGSPAVERLREQAAGSR